MRRPPIAISTLAIWLDRPAPEQPIHTLDTLVPAGRRVSILHLDVEGHERPALLGARRIVEHCAPMIVLEAGRPWQRQMYADFLAEQFPDKGYRLCGAMERNAFFLPQT